MYGFPVQTNCSFGIWASGVAGPGFREDTSMENNEKEIRKLGPIVETVWGVLLLALSGVLIFIGA